MGARRARIKKTGNNFFRYQRVLQLGGGIAACNNVPNSACSDFGIDSRNCSCQEGYWGTALAE
jgi:hypothetical protein